MRYKPFGEVRYTWRASQTTTPAYALSRFTFTGQYSHMDDPSTSGVTEGFGLMFYNARWYDPALGRFAQADTIIPAGVQGLDRYAYANNNPIHYTDPSGHVVCEVGEPCGRGATYVEETSTAQMNKNLEDKLGNEYGVTLQKGTRSWDSRNIYAAYAGMFNVDKALNGQTESILGPTTFILNWHSGEGDYRGTSYPGLTIFEATTTIPSQNLYHEFAHLLNYASGGAFERRVDAQTHEVAGNYIFGGSAGIMSEARGFGLKFSDLTDPNYGIITDVIQHPDTDPSEQWSDLFANYAAGNIDMSSSAGQEIHTFVNSSLTPDISLISGR
ncbi:MAG TPA: RHS repeat-associated core domain-containing protein [Anaerolineales bacterium]|nr:RHS repeat-associated core domain-containing protein [Anaerolineales bacterium]HNN14573.1 RHS repeat-associated core domain-containing protein [Anaerolineales bacterium]